MENQYVSLLRVDADRAGVAAYLGGDARELFVRHVQWHGTTPEEPAERWMALLPRAA